MHTGTVTNCKSFWKSPIVYVFLVLFDAFWTLMVRPGETQSAWNSSSFHLSGGGNLFSYCYCLFFFLFKLIGRVRGDTVHLLVHLSSCHNSLGCARSKPGDWKPIWVSHTDGKGPGTWAMLCCFPRCTCRELSRKWSSHGDSNSISAWIGDSLVCCATVVAPVLFRNN